VSGPIDRRVVLWRACGIALLTIAAVLTLAIIPAHRPRDPHDALLETLVAGTMGQAPVGWRFSPASYPWMYALAGVIAVVGIERLLRGGRRGTSPA